MSRIYTLRYRYKTAAKLDNFVNENTVDPSSCFGGQRKGRHGCEFCACHAIWPSLESPGQRMDISQHAGYVQWCVTTSGSDIRSSHRHRSIRHPWLPINVPQQPWAYLVPFPRWTAIQYTNVTDGQTDTGRQQRARLRIASRGKNWQITIYVRFQCESKPITALEYSGRNVCTEPN